MIRIALLGAGIITECHCIGLDKTDAQVVAVASADKILAANACKKFGARYYCDYNELLEKEKGEVDAVVVALPNHLHLEACRSIISNGYKAILCEKPLATNAADAAEIVRMAKEENVFFQTAYMKRYNPGFQKIKAALDTMGNIEFATCSIYFSGSEPTGVSSGEPTHWYGDLKKSGGACLTHNGSHHIDLMRYLFGEVISVRANIKYEPHNAAEYYVRGQLEMDSGVQVDMRIGRVDVPNLGPNFTIFRDGWNETVEVIGSGGYIKCENPTWQGYEAVKVKQWSRGDVGPETYHMNCELQWVNEFVAFIDNIQKGQYDPSSSTVVDGYRADAIIEAMHASAKQNGERVILNYQY